MGVFNFKGMGLLEKERFEITTQHHNAKSLLVSRGVAMALLRSVRKI